MEFSLDQLVHVVCMHGDESIPKVVMEESNTPFIVANLRALEQNTRYIHQDLNASFGIDNDSYESERAKVLLQTISENSIVIDWHTYTDASEPFCVITDLSMMPVVETIGLPKVLYMKFNIKGGHSLLDHRSGVSVEVGQHNSVQAMENTKSVLKSLQGRKQLPVEIFEVYEEITIPGQYQNFIEHAEGFIPVLANGSDYLGLKARKI